MSKSSDVAKEKLNFFIEMISLLSNLCKDRNYEAIIPLSAVFKRRTCFEIVKNKEFIPAIRTCFVMLIHTMYVDVSEIKKITLPNNIRAWTEIDNAKPIMSIFEAIDLNSINQP